MAAVALLLLIVSLRIYGLSQGDTSLRNLLSILVYGGLVVFALFHGRPQDGVKIEPKDVAVDVLTVAGSALFFAIVIFR